MTNPGVETQKEIITFKHIKHGTTVKTISKIL